MRQNVAGDVQIVLHIGFHSLEILHALSINLGVFPRSEGGLFGECRMLVSSEARPKSVDVRNKTPSQTLSRIIDPCPVTTTKIISLKECRPHSYLFSYSFLVLIVLWRHSITFIEALGAWQNSENLSLETRLHLSVPLSLDHFIDLCLQPVLLNMEIPIVSVAYSSISLREMIEL